MSNISESFTEKVLHDMKQFYKDYTVESPPGAIFRARTDDAMITAYKSGKVLFQGKNPQAEFNIWQKWKEEEQLNGVKMKQQTEHTFSPPSHLFDSSHIGSDESGSGDYFGPITTCAIYIHKDNINHLKEIGIQDSKAIQDDHIHTLANTLIELDIPYSLMILNNEKYNALQQRGWSQGKMKTMLHHHTIHTLFKKINRNHYDGIIIDQFCQPHIFKRHLSTEQETLAPSTYFMTKAEHYSIAVAAASVIARASFLNEMERLSNNIGFQLLKGASQRVDKQIAQIIKQNGHDILNRFAKLHFANTKKAEYYL